MLPSINPLVLNMKESATLYLNQRVRALRAAGREVYHFGFGQAPFPVPTMLQESLKAHADKNMYLPTQGLPALREAASHFFEKEFCLDFRPGDVFVGPGSKELIFQLSYLVEGALLVPVPSWVSYGPQATLRGKKLVPVRTSRERGYRLTAEELDRACHENEQVQKLLILNHPNNPTGSVYSREELQDLAQICRAYNVLVISDEIYAFIDFSDRPFTSMSHYYPEGTIVTSGLSKYFSAGGYRLGVMMVPVNLDVIQSALRSVISETYSTVCAPVQHAAAEAYGRFEELRPELDLNNEIFRFASTYLWERFTGMGMNCPRPEGAFYLFPDFEPHAESLRRRGIITGTRLTRTLLEERGVAFLPGSDFYFPATNLGVRVASVDFDGAAVRDAWPDTAIEDRIDLFPRLKAGCDELEGFLRDLTESEARENRSKVV